MSCSSSTSSVARSSWPGDGPPGPALGHPTGPEPGCQPRGPGSQMIAHVTAGYERPPAVRDCARCSQAWFEALASALLSEGESACARPACSTPTGLDWVQPRDRTSGQLCCPGTGRELERSGGPRETICGTLAISPGPNRRPGAGPSPTPGVSRERDQAGCRGLAGCRGPKPHP